MLIHLSAEIPDDLFKSGCERIQLNFLDHIKSMRPLFLCFQDKLFEKHPLNMIHIKEILY